VGATTLVDKPTYRRLTAVPTDLAPVEIGVEWPILHLQLDLEPVAGDVRQTGHTRGWRRRPVSAAARRRTRTVNG
jgi:hypothetical protein